MKSKRWILNSIVVIMLVVSGVTIYFFNTPDANEIVFVGYQFVPPTAHNEKGTFIYTLINSKGQYYLLSKEEALEQGKSIQEIIDYYSSNKSKANGIIMTTFDMYLCREWMEKVDTGVVLDFKFIDSMQEREGVNLYYVTEVGVMQVNLLDDLNAKKITNKLLRNWPID